MAKIKMKKKSTTTDMTAMCDVAFLLLTFFILTATAKIPEVLPVDTPSSTVQTKLPETDLATITIGKGKVFFDYNQNSFGKTLASIFSPRPVEDATVSVPLKWEELGDIVPTDFTIKTVPGIYKRKISPWKDILSRKQNLEEILERISDFKV